jgi:hypothetical protein
MAFKWMPFMCGGLAVLSPEHLRLSISMLLKFGQQTDMNIALAAGQSRSRWITGTPFEKQPNMLSGTHRPRKITYSRSAPN